MKANRFKTNVAGAPLDSYRKMKHLLDELMTGGNIAGEILETLPVGLILLDTECHVVFLNRQQEKLSRISREQVLGTVFHQTWHRLFKVRHYADTYWKLINKKEPYCYIYPDIFSS